MTDKKFHLAAEQIEKLIDDPRGCLATDRIVVQGEPVGFMYREASGHESDSGWRFMAGDESNEYMADSNNVGVYALNSLANYDRRIIKLLDAPIGAAFASEQPGEPLQPVAGADAVHGDLHPDYPVVEGEYQLTNEWALVLPVACNRRIEDGTMVLWRRDLTVHITAWDNTTDATIEERTAQLLDSVSPAATNLERSDEPDLTRVSYRLVESGVEFISLFMVCASAQLLAQVNFDGDVAEAHAEQIAASIGYVQPMTA